MSDRTESGPALRTPFALANTLARLRLRKDLGLAPSPERLRAAAAAARLREAVAQAGPSMRVRRSKRPRATGTRESWSRPLAASITLLMSSALLLGSCGALWGPTAALVSRTQTTIDRGGVSLPGGGPLDAELPQTARIHARDGALLAEVNDVRFGRRIAMPLSAMASDLILATVAVEDRRFFQHTGVDFVGFVRALAQNAASEDVASGASTLEMQLIRNLFLPDERAEQTLSRKLKEAIAAYKLDQHSRKVEVLESYLNSVFYSNRAYGAEAAAQRYFGKPARELSLPEAALLAGIPQAPSAHDPLLHFDAAKRRQEYVLDLMAQASFISSEQAAAAKAARLEFRDPEPVPARASHWVNYISDLVRARFGPEMLFTGGLNVRTTLDPAVQEIAEHVVAANESVRQQAHANNTAMVVIDPRTGEVLAMAGSKDFWDTSMAGQVNVAVAGRQPGSAIKPLVFLAGFEKGLNPYVVVNDALTVFPAPTGQVPYVPHNFGDRYFGRVTLRDALGNSLNVPAVKVLKYVGVPTFQDLARRLGISTLDEWDRQWLSLTLGGGEIQLLELTSAYATIAALGERRPSEPFLAVETARGEVLYAGTGQFGRQVVDPRLAYQLLHVMGDPGARQATFGQSTPLNLSRPHMVKTGTTDDYRDTWTVGCLPQVCVGVWMGNTNNEPMSRVTSSLTAGKIWVDMMYALVDRYGWPPTAFPRPDGLVAHRVAGVGSVRISAREYEEVFLAERQQQYLLEMNWTSPEP